MTVVPLDAFASVVTSGVARSFYDIIKFTPLKIHLSFSQGGSASDDGDNKLIQSEFFNLLLKSVGVSLTEFSDVVLK